MNKYYIGGGIVLLIGVIVFATSWDTLSPLERGLNYDTIGYTVEKNAIYGEGRYILGPGHSDNDSDAPALQTQTTVGDVIYLSVTVLFKIKPDKLMEIYNKYGENGWKSRFANILTDSIKSVASEGGYVLSSFYSNRRDVQAYMLNKVTESLEPEHAMVYKVFLDVGFGGEVASKIINQLISNELVNTEKQIQKASLTRLNISVIKSSAKQYESIVLNEAASKADIVKEKAEAKAFSIVVDAEGESYRQLG